MNNKKNTPDGTIKMYRGAYNYKTSGSQYAEETFDAYKDKKDGCFQFHSQVISRVSTGELLKVDVEYYLNKDWTPKRVVISKNLGKESIQEIFICDNRKNNIEYQFINSKGEMKTALFSCPPRFHIMTPAVSSNFVFVLSKKFDINGRNNYTIYTTDNHWEFKNEPKQMTVTLVKENPTSDSILIDGNSLQGDEYKMSFKDGNQDDESAIEHELSTYLSRYATIPYKIEDKENEIKIQVKYLNNLDPDA